MTTLVAMLGAMMAIIDTSIVNVALPSIRESLHASVNELSMIVTGFIIAGVIVMPLIGWLNAFLGRKRFFMLAMGLFTLASIACGLAWNVESLAIFRVLQGLGGGALIPAAQAIMLESWPREQHGKAMSTFGLGIMAGPALGPPLGGWLTEALSWEWIFFINVPIGLLAITLAGRHLQDMPARKKPQGKFDWPGLVTMIIGLVSLQLVLEHGHALGWFRSARLTGLAVLAAVFLILFIRRERRTDHPVVDLSVMRERTFALSSVIGTVVGFGLFGVLVILPLFMASILGFDAGTIGLALLPAAVGTALVTPLSGFLTDRVEPRVSIAVGLMLSVASLWLFAALPPDAGYWQVFIPMLLRGLGLGLIFVPMTTIAMTGIQGPRLTGASGLHTLIRQIGGSFGVAILTTLLVHQQEIRGMHPQAQLLAYRDVFHLAAIMFLLCFIPLWLLGKQRSPAIVPEL